ncbi:MAG: hypothetical protein ACKO23_08090 [Gemmataceae bacterium]
MSVDIAAFSRLLCLAMSLVLGGVSSLQAEATNRAGTWKLTLPNARRDMTFWIIAIEPDGSKMKLVSGLAEFASSKISDVKSDDSQLSFTITQGTNRFLLSVRSPDRKEREEMYGSVQMGNNILPLWLSRTTVEELIPGNAVRETPGSQELEAAMKNPDAEERTREMEVIRRKYAGKPIEFHALQAMFLDRLARQVKPEEFKEIIEAYRDLAGRHGGRFQVAANLDLSRNLLSNKVYAPLAVDIAREALKNIKPDYPSGLRLTAQMTLAAGLNTQGKTDEVEAIAKNLAQMADEELKGAKSPTETLVGTERLAVLFLGSSAPAVADVGLELARRAVKSLRDDMPLAQKAVAQRLLGRALVSRGKLDEARTLEPIITQLDLEMDREYLKETITFPITKMEKRPTDSTRVVLVEFFTGSQYRQAVPAHIAFDALLQTYPPRDVAFLQYHVAMPDADSLVCPDGEKRKDFYKTELSGVPAMFVDGKMAGSVGGARHRGQASYDLMKAAIDKALEPPTGADLLLSVTRTGDTIIAKASVSGLKKPGSNIRLRFVLVEERIRYQGASGVRLQQNVVRAFLGGSTGFGLTQGEATQTASINLVQLRQSIGEFLEGLARKVGVPNPVKPLDLSKLKIIAFVQDEESKQVLAAAQTSVPQK